jgi:hypothetical protein
MASAPVNPSPDEVTNLASALTWLRDWGWSVLVAIGVPGAWWGSAAYTEIKNTQKDHAGDIAALKAGRAAADIAIAALPSRDEMNRRFDRIDQRLDDALGFSRRQND